MNVKQTVSEKLKQEFHVIIESDEIKRRVADSLTSKIKNIKMPGFRPGKVPLSIVRQRYEDSTTQEVINDVIQDSSRKLLKENKLRPASQPTYELEPYENGKNFSFRLKVETLPEVALPDYSKIKIKKITSSVSDDEVEAAVNEHAKSKMFFTPAPENAVPAKDDRVIISLETWVGKNPIKAFTVKDVNVRIGSGYFLFDFIEKELMTKKVGETFSLEHSFDENYLHKPLAGKTAHFTVTVVSHDTLTTLSVGSEYAKACGFETLDALKQQFRSNLEFELKQNIHLYHKRILLDALSEMYDFDLPESMLTAEFDAIWSRLKAEMEEARKQGQLAPEDDKSDDELRREYKAIAERRVRLGLVISEIAQKQGIRLTDKMIQDLIVREAMKYQGQERQIVDFYRKTPQAIEALTAPALEDMVVLFVLDKTDSKEEVLTKQELRKKFIGVLPGFEEEDATEKAQKKEKPAKVESTEKTGKNKADTEKPKKAKKDEQLA